jgi:sirohydrochlorin ferrochelatase
MRHPHLIVAGWGRGPAHGREARPAYGIQALDGRGGLPSAGAWPPLVAVAHGSTDPRAGVTVASLMRAAADCARRSGLAGLRVRAAYLGHALQSVTDVLESMCGAPERAGRGGGDVIVLPLLLTPAYHSNTDLPEVLREAVRQLPWLRISYGSALGPHPRLIRAAERRLAEAGVPADAGMADTAVVLAAAGSSRPDANAAVASLAAAWQSSRRCRAVVPAFASAHSPTPGQAVAALLRSGARRVVVASYLLAPGVFADQVRQQSLDAGAIAVSAPLGAAPEVAEVIVERYLEAAQLGGARPGAEAGRGALG